MPTKQGLFLKRFFYNTPAIIVVFVIVMVTVAGYLFYSKASNNPAKTTAKLPNNQVQAKETTTIPDAESKEKKKPVKLALDWEPDENLYSEKKLIVQFEENALAETPAIRIKVPKLGNVMFAINRPDLEKLPEIMEQLAELYMDTVNRSNPVTVYFMVGGGVRGVHTFLPE